MIDRQALLKDLQGLLRTLEADLLQRSDSDEVPEVGRRLRGEYDRAKEAERTAQNYEDWRSATITQAAAAWVLSCVFVRFLEDNRLIDPPKIAGPGKRLQQARDEWELYLGQAEQPNERDYLLSVFDELARLPGAGDIFGQHNPVRELPNWLSGDGARELLTFFQRIDADTGKLVHDFTDPDWETRFLGDLYQDLSEAARKRYALLQTPEFVEEFILERTLEPAIEQFGLEGNRRDAETLRGKVGNTNSNPTLSSASPRLCGDSSSGFRMIDPACGSGHFLLGSFRRILDRWQKHDPGAGTRELVRRTLASIHGVDVNPYAVAIARFRLLLVAMRAEGIARLAHAPGYEFNLACGDSLWHAPLRGTAKVGRGQREFDALAPEADESQGHTYFAEDAHQLTRLLEEGRYHCVVANPPYITPKDSALNQEYRNRYASCHRQYSLAVPFMERLFRLAVKSGQSSGVSRQSSGGSTDNCELTTDNLQAAGYVGQITANSFMKREFGKKLIEKFLPGIDLTHVIDTSGAYIPGHGTPTVILFGRNRRPVAKTIRAVMGIRGEPSTPDDPARGLVWTAILNQIDQPGSESEFVSAGDSPRELYHKHPWSIGGGGAAELKERLESHSSRLRNAIMEVGRTVGPGDDDAWWLGASATAKRLRLHGCFQVLVTGQNVRDFTIEEDVAERIVYPYELNTRSPLERLPLPLASFLWPNRIVLRRRVIFGRPIEAAGHAWWEYLEHYTDRLRTPLSIVYGEVATHNHFVLDRGGKVFNRTAPVIKLPPGTSEDDHLALLGLLNSSTACFWMKQVCFPKGGDHVGQEGARVRRSLWDERYAFNATNLQSFPLPEARPTELLRQLDTMARQLQAQRPDAILTQRREDAKKQPENQDLGALAPLREALTAARRRFEQLRGQMIALQEELDWECYGLYGLLGGAVSGQQSAVSKMKEADSCSLNAESLPAIAAGQRAFEIVLARKMARSEAQTTWFKRHGTTPITDLPDDWPDDYRRLVERRIELIEKDRNIGLIEQPEYKRRWNTEPWESQLERALREWLLNRLESYFDFDGRMGEGKEPQRRKDAEKTGETDSLQGVLSDSASPRLVSIARLADVASRDPEFMEVGEVYRDDKAFDVQHLVEELVTAESVPLLPVLRYKPAGLRKRAEWEKTWELQREGDRTGKQLDIPVPPKYKSSDFQSSNYWRLRGKLDVPKERWVSFPHCEGPDGTLLIAWAGYDHLQLAQAVSAYYVDVQERLGGRDDPRLVPLLACLIELLPWLGQWHNEPDANFDRLRMGDYFEGFVQEEARQLGKTLPEIKAWEPEKKSGGRRRRKGSP